MKDNFKMANMMDLEYIIGLMVSDIMETLWKERLMVKELDTIKMVVIFF
jgi:hypothetical protein